jgi:simple sugar transport system ATP-binding protein
MSLTACESSECSVLQMSGITKRFGSLVANDNVSFSLDAGEVVALLGENGAGKTTLMNILFGHYVADEGTIEVSGKRLTPGTPQAALAAGIGMVHQHFTLGENLSVVDNVVIGTEPLVRPWRSRGARERIAEISKRFGLAVNPDAMIRDLSVGERQRVEIVKALYRDVRILVMDEPTAVLTPQETDTLFATLKHLVREGVAIVFISHKLREVMEVADKVIVMRQGQLVAERRVRETTRDELAELMVGRPVLFPTKEAISPGKPALRLDGIVVRQRATVQTC